MIQFLDLKSQHAKIKEEILAGVSRVIDSGNFILGPELKRFEVEFSEFCGSKFCVGVGNGLDALTLSLRALDIGTGDEVIVPEHTFIATWLAVSAVGAVPVSCPVSDETYTISHSALENIVTSKTKAIIPVHLYGICCEMDHISSFAKKYKLFVIEDSAQAHGSIYKGRNTGSFGDLACFSFYPGKNLGALGDAGCIVGNNLDLYHKLLKLRNYGSQVKYKHELQGGNSRLDEIQAAILCTKLKYLDESNKKRQVIVQTYMKGLQGIGDIQLPKVPGYQSPAWHLFVIRTKFRNELRDYLSESGIQTLIHYPESPSHSEAYLNMLSAADKISSVAYQSLNNEVLSLPLGPHLESEDVSFVIEKVKDFYRK